MKNIFKLLIATFVSLTISVLILVFLSSLNGTAVEGNEILYALVIEVGQMIFPFLLYVIISDFLIKKIVTPRVSTKDKKILIHFAVYISLMIIIATLWSLGDIFFSGYDREFVYYIKEFGIFIVFSPIVSIVTYLIGSKYKYQAARNTR